MTLHISSMIPDRALEESALFKAVTGVAMGWAGFANHALQKKAPILSIVYMLPSRRENAGFQGLRLHSFQKDTQTLTMEAAVPENMLESVHAERYVIAILLDAIEAAAEYFGEQCILFDAPGHSALVEALAPNPRNAMH